MEYVNLGRSGLKVSKIILGGMGFGAPEWQGWVLDEEKSLPLLEHAYKSGINTWDTADAYSHGRSEEIFGAALKKYNIPRHRVVLMTKCFLGVDDEGKQPPMHSAATNDGQVWVNRVGLSRKHIFDAVDASISRLGTHIDVLQIHRLDRQTPREEIMRALNDVVNSGKVRYIGASSMAAWEFQALQNIAIKNNWHQFISMQSYYSLIGREEEREMIPYCKDAGIGLIPWSPLARGVLARPVGNNTSREGHDIALTLLVRNRESDSDRAIITRVEELSKKKGVSMAQIATAWAIQQGVNPILGLNSIERINEAVNSIKVKLTAEEMKYLEEPYVPKGLSVIERNIRDENPQIIHLQDRDHSADNSTIKGIEVNIGEYEDVSVVVYNARPNKEEYTLENGGFALVQHYSKIADFQSREQLDKVYSTEIADLVRSLTGADDVVIYSPPVLRQTETQIGSTHQPRAADVHTDYSPAYAEYAAREHRPMDMAYSRYAFVNVWRALSPPPQDWPLAVVDARSVSLDEGVPYPMIIVDKIPEKLPIIPQPPYTIEGANFCYNSEHKWYYFKDMKIDEVLVFKLIGNLG
ncbi:hypothetical protein B7463_g8989, partial [Scytalidium lignicola]